jgi:hypothetical protein
MSLTKVTYSMINGPVANVADFGADPTGVADSYAAIQAALDSDAAIIQFPAGTFKVTQTIVLDRGIQFCGAGAQDGSGNNGQSSGVASTVINYTGTGNAIEVGANYTEQVSNIHVSNLMITGNALADGGLFIGTQTGANKCTFKNLGIFNFDNATANKGYGVGIRNCILSLFENVYVHGCNDGFNIGFNACTSLQFNSCYSRVNNQYGWLIRQGNGMSWYQCTAEGNLKTGLVINADNGQNVSQLGFYSWYSEFNGDDADTYPGALVRSTGTGVCKEIIFYSPVFYDYSTYNVGAGVWDIACIKLGLIEGVRFLNASVTSTNSNFIECQSGTTLCEWQGRGATQKTSNNITSNGIESGSIRVLTAPAQTPVMSTFANVSVTDAFTTAWAIPASTIGQLMVLGQTDGQYGGFALFAVGRTSGNAGVNEISGFVGDGSSYTMSWQLSGNNFQLKHNQAGQTIDVQLAFMSLVK